MVDVAIGEFVKYRNPLIEANASLRVWVWDCGPEKPVPPERPIAPKGVEGDPEYDLAKLDFRELLEKYDDDLRRYGEQKKEYAEFQKRMGGPVEIWQWSVDARDTFRHDARAVEQGRQKKLRYYLSSRTRGYEKLKNRGLPVGIKPGHGHQANLERQIAGDKEFIAALKADPQFGQELTP